MRPLRYILVAGAAALGALFAVGCLIAALFEVQGFGGPRDEGPRSGYLVQLAVGFVACIAIPAFLSRRLLHVGAGWVAAAAAVSVAGVLVILGLSLSAK